MTQDIGIVSQSPTRDLCKTPLFAQFLRQSQILILEILNVFLWFKFSPSLNLNKNEHFSKVSTLQMKLPPVFPHKLGLAHYVIFHCF